MIIGIMLGIIPFVFAEKQEILIAECPDITDCSWVTNNGCTDSGTFYTCDNAEKIYITNRNITTKNTTLHISIEYEQLNTKYAMLFTTDDCSTGTNWIGWMKDDGTRMPDVLTAGGNGEVPDTDGLTVAMGRKEMKMQFEVPNRNFTYYNISDMSQPSLSRIYSDIAGLPNCISLKDTRVGEGLNDVLIYNVSIFEWALAPEDETPPVILKIEDQSGSTTNKTDDGTPTINATTDGDASCGISADNQSWTAFSTTGATEHIGTVPVSATLPISSEVKVYVNCTDSSDNSGYGFITYNITDGVSPECTFIAPNDDNFTSTDKPSFTFNCSDNHNDALTGNLYIESVLNNTGATTNITAITLQITDIVANNTVVTWNPQCVDNHSNTGTCGSRSLYKYPLIAGGAAGECSLDCMTISAGCTAYTEPGCTSIRGT